MDVPYSLNKKKIKLGFPRISNCHILDNSSNKITILKKEKNIISLIGIENIFDETLCLGYTSFVLQFVSPRSHLLNGLFLDLLASPHLNNKACISSPI